jgi:hypothetical protein
MAYVASSGYGLQVVGPVVLFVEVFVVDLEPGLDRAELAPVDKPVRHNNGEPVWAGETHPKIPFAAYVFGSPRSDGLPGVVDAHVVAPYLTIGIDREHAGFNMSLRVGHGVSAVHNCRLHAATCG